MNQMGLWMLFYIRLHVTALVPLGAFFLKYARIVDVVDVTLFLHFRLLSISFVGCIQTRDSAKKNKKRSRDLTIKFEKHIKT